MFLAFAAERALGQKQDPEEVLGEMDCTWSGRSVYDVRTRLACLPYEKFAMSTSLRSNLHERVTDSALFC